MSAHIFVTDDAINEAMQQVFIAELMIVGCLDPARVDLTVQPSTLCRILDNDCKYESIVLLQYYESNVSVIPLYIYIYIHTYYICV